MASRLDRCSLSSFLRSTITSLGKKASSNLPYRIQMRTDAKLESAINLKLICAIRLLVAAWASAAATAGACCLMNDALRAAVIADAFSLAYCNDSKDRKSTRLNSSHLG